jgi:hypothetical protein
MSEMSKRKHKQRNDDDQHGIFPRGSSLEVPVTQEDLDEGARLDLDIREVLKRAFERALRKKEQH